MEYVDRARRERPSRSLLDVMAVASVGIAVIGIGWMFVGDDPFRRQAVAWVGNVAMLITIRIGLQRRGQAWAHLGLAFRPGSARSIGRTVLQSIAVFAAALVGFLLGSMLVLNLTSITADATAGNYGYLQGNLPMLVAALAGVYVVSSFGEEVIYRGFLMTRVAEAGGTTAGAWRVAVVVSAIVFGLIHFTWGVLGIVQTTFMGLALAIAYQMCKRNLWVLVLAHAYMDTILLVQMYLGAPGTIGD